MKKYCILLSTALALAGCQFNQNDSSMNQDRLAYPATYKDTTVVDDYFGTKVADPYRWLENDTSAQTKAWVEAENKITFGYLKSIPFSEKIRTRLTEIVNYERYDSPFKEGEHYFFTKNDGLQNQSVIYYQKGLEGAPEVFLDPNSLSKDGTTRAQLAGFSKDKKYTVIATNPSGGDWQEMEVMEVSTKKKLSDRLKWIKFSGAAWYKNGFFYSRYAEPKKGEELSGQNQFQKVYYHTLGDAQSKDQLVYEDPKHPLRYFGIGTTEDERFAILYISEGTDGTEIMVKDLTEENSDFKLLFKGFEHNYTIVDNLNDKLLVYHNKGVSNYKVSLADPKTGKMTDFIPEKPEKLESVGTAGGKLFASYLKDVVTKVYQYDIAKGTLEREIPMPGVGSAWGFNGYNDDRELFYTFTSFNVPSTIYRYNIATGKSSIFRQPKVKFNPEDYETKQVFYPSKDGTKIPMFLTYKKGIALNGTAPTLLYAYGGFNISETPYFSASNLILLENGGIYAVANLRGGGEYGEKWHKAGMLLKKQNVFDDFIAAAEYLIAKGYTSKDYLAIEGGSNGGLLVGACMTQRPDLYRVCFPAVGVMDMLRFHKFTVGWGWVVEYGSAEKSKEDFKNLYGYSPLHTLKDSTEYPATMVTTADHDDRVVPAHSFKFAATLQEKHKGPHPVLIRIDTQAGHGGSSLSKAIDYSTDTWSFMFANIGIIPNY